VKVGEDGGEFEAGEDFGSVYADGGAEVHGGAFRGIGGRRLCAVSYLGAGRKGSPDVDEVRRTRDCEAATWTR
jgi:hypothetical protein